MIKITLRKIEGIFKDFCIYLFASSVCLLMAVILLRELFGISYDFLTDAVVWLTIWSALLLSGPLYGEGGHVAIGFVLEKLSGKLRTGLELFNALCTLAYVATVTVGGILMIRIFYSQGQIYARYIAIPMWIVQICVPIGFGLFSIYAVAELWKIVQKARG